MAPPSSLVLILGLGCAAPSSVRSSSPGPASGTQPTTPSAPTYNGCGAPDGVRATGSWEDPVVIPGFPFTDTADTTAAPASDAGAYDCAPETGEGGGEVVYRLSVPATAYLRAEVSEADGVDVDLHLLPATAAPADMVSDCLYRDNTVIEQAELPAGEYLLVVDTYTDPSGAAQPGAYTVGVEVFVPNVWSEVTLSPGLSWRHLRQRAPYQSLDVLVVDPSQRDITPVNHGGCRPVEDVAAERGARAAINASFFDDACNSLLFMRADGATLSTASLGDGQRVLAWDDGGPISATDVAEGQRDLSAANGVGSYPALIHDGQINVDPNGTTDFFTGRHPRTAMGVRADGALLLLTADGRSDHGDGFTLAELADQLLDLGATEAINLDGGGSTTAYVAGCSVNGVVNHPSDGGGVGHDGARSVSDGVYVD